MNFRRKPKKEDRDREAELERLALAEARRALHQARAENTWLRAKLQQLQHGVRTDDDDDVIAP